MGAIVSLLLAIVSLLEIYFPVSVRSAEIGSGEIRVSFLDPLSPFVESNQTRTTLTTHPRFKGPTSNSFGGDPFGDPFSWGLAREGNRYFLDGVEMPIDAITAMNLPFQEFDERVTVEWGPSDNSLQFIGNARVLGDPNIPPWWSEFIDQPKGVPFVAGELNYTNGESLGGTSAERVEMIITTSSIDGDPDFEQLLSLSIGIESTPNVQDDAGHLIDIPSADYIYFVDFPELGTFRVFEGESTSIELLFEFNSLDLVGFGKIEDPSVGFVAPVGPIVPEPSGVGLLTGALLACIGLRRRWSSRGVHVLGLYVVLLGTVVAIVAQPKQVRAQIVVHEPGWLLVQETTFSNPGSITFNPLDEHFYFGQRASNGDVFRWNGDGTTTNVINRNDWTAGIDIDPANGNLFVSDDFGGRIRRYTFDTNSGIYSGSANWVSGFQGGDDDTAGIAIIPSNFSGNLNGVSPGDALNVDRDNFGNDDIYRWNPNVPQNESRIYTGNLSKDIWDITVTSDKIFVADDSNTDQVFQIINDGDSDLTLQALSLNLNIGGSRAIATDVLSDELLVGSRDGKLYRITQGGDVSLLAEGFGKVAFGALSLNNDGSRLLIASNTSGMVFELARVPEPSTAILAIAALVGFTCFKSRHIRTATKSIAVLTPFVCLALAQHTLAATLFTGSGSNAATVKVNYETAAGDITDVDLTTLNTPVTIGSTQYGALSNGDVVDNLELTSLSLTSDVTLLTPSLSSTGLTGTLQVLRSISTGRVRFSPGGFASSGSRDEDDFQINYINPVLAFGVMINGNFPEPAESYSVMDINGAIVASGPLGGVSSGTGGFFFLGVVNAPGDPLIKSVLINEGQIRNDDIGFSDLSYAVPEPSGMVLLAIGSLVATLRRKRLCIQRRIDDSSHSQKKQLRWPALGFLMFPTMLLWGAMASVGNTQTIFNESYTGADLVAFPLQTARPISVAGSNLNIGPGGVNLERLLEIPIVSAGTLAQDQLTAISIGLTESPPPGASSDHDISVGVSDGEFFTGFVRLNNSGWEGAIFSGEETEVIPTYDEVLFSNAGFDPTFIAMVTTDGMITTVNGSFGSREGGGTSLVTLDPSKDLSLVIHLDHTFESYSISELNVTVTAIPEPSSILLLLPALCGLFFARRSRFVAKIAPMMLLVAVMVATSTCSAQMLGEELVVNGGAETGDTSGWISTGIDAITPDAGASGFGSFVFHGGTGPAANQTLKQVVDVSTFSSQIDSGEITSVFSIYLQARRSSVRIDTAEATLAFMDDADVELQSISFTDESPVNVFDDWDLFSDERIVPVGTRTIELFLNASRTGGVSSDGFFDEASLVLHAVPEPTTLSLLLFGITVVCGRGQRP